jgi:hypothetical protein
MPRVCRAVWVVVEVVEPPWEAWTPCKFVEILHTNGCSGSMYGCSESMYGSPCNGEQRYEGKQKPYSACGPTVMLTVYGLKNGL